MWPAEESPSLGPFSESLTGSPNCRVLEESSLNRIAFNSLYLLKYFGMVTMKQKEGNCIEHACERQTAEPLLAPGPGAHDGAAMGF